ncbi:MAG TPA: chloride channel protein [Tepidisphaeraceae bacterium]|nr:chloride channel protein [Tepidisphaeraceae bacterium]
METFASVPEREEKTDGSNSNQNGGVVLSTARLWMWAAVIGLVGGLLALAYYIIMREALHYVWDVGAHTNQLALGYVPAFHPVILLVTTVGGFIVGLLLHYMGTPGEIAAVVNNIHMEHGRIDPSQTPSMTAVSLASIVSGGSAGPEAPLVQIIGSFGSWLGDKLKLRGDLVRTLTFCGMGAALGAFFGAPLGGAIFALEIPHRRGLEYYEALMPSILAAVVAFFIFRSFIGYNGAIYHFPAITSLTVGAVFWGVVAGIVGAGIGTLFIVLFHGVEHLLYPLAKQKILLATIGGVLIGLIAQLAPATLFWGEYQIDALLHAGGPLAHMHGIYVAAGLLLLLALMKTLAVGATLHSGFRGGFIFPLFFIGAAVGVALSLVLSLWFPQLPAPVIILGIMAATNVAVTKTPISTVVILTSLSGTAFIPALVAACFASFLLTTRVSLISTQRSRISALGGKRLQAG